MSRTKAERIPGTFVNSVVNSNTSTTDILQDQLDQLATASPDFFPPKIAVGTRGRRFRSQELTTFWFQNSETAIFSCDNMVTSTAIFIPYSSLTHLVEHIDTDLVATAVILTVYKTFGDIFGQLVTEAAHEKRTKTRCA